MHYKYYATVLGERYEIEIDEEGVRVNGELYDIDFHELPETNMLSLIINNRSLEAAVEQQEESMTVLIKGELYEVEVQDERAFRLAQARGITKKVSGVAEIKSPMPGTIIAVPVTQGDTVAKGDKIIILESMKMENELRAPRDGVVTAVKVEAGASVEKGQVLAIVSEPKDSNGA